jgi:hypothetical protein
MKAKLRLYCEAAERELKHWPNVTIVSTERASGSGNDKLILAYNGKTRFVIKPHSPSDCAFGHRRHLRDIRRVCKELGAIRKD